MAAQIKNRYHANQWGSAGNTTQDLYRCQVMARHIALIYNWWSLFVAWLRQTFVFRLTAPAVAPPAARADGRQPALPPKCATGPAAASFATATPDCWRID